MSSGNCVFYLLMAVVLRRTQDVSCYITIVMLFLSSLETLQVESIYFLFLVSDSSSTPDTPREGISHMKEQQTCLPNPLFDPSRFSPGRDSHLSFPSFLSLNSHLRICLLTSEREAPHTKAVISPEKKWQLKGSSKVKLGNEHRERPTVHVVNIC